MDSFLLLCLTALCLPKTQWAADFIRALGAVLKVPDGSIHGALPLLYSPRQHNDCSMLERAEKLAASLRSTMTRESALSGFLTIFLIVLHGQELAAMERSKRTSRRRNDNDERIDPKVLQLLRFDARTSVLLRRLALLLRIKLSALSKLEDVAVRQMQQSVLIHPQRQQDEEDKGNSKSQRRKQQWIRATKICAGAVAAGGVLAVTGGMAAPALATGLATLGFATAATYATTAAVAALLGAGGASFGAYKMTNRTKGLTRFAFQQINTQRQTQHDRVDHDMKGMTVYICISGYLRQSGPVSPEKTETNNNSVSSMLFSTDASNSSDFYAPWGAEPPVKFTSLVLDRFYSVVAPDRRKLVPHLLRRYSGQEKEMMDELERLYGVHPLKLAPPQAQPNHYVENDETEHYNYLLNHGITNLKKTIGMTREEVQESLTQETLIYSTELMNLLMDDEKPWEEAFESPKPDEDPAGKDETNPTKDKQPEIQETSQHLPSRTREALANEMEAINLTQSAVDESENDKEKDNKEEEAKFEEISFSSSQESLSSSQHSLSSSSHSVSSSPPIRNEVYWWRQSIANHGDQYTVVWEPENLLAIGKCLQDIIMEGLSKGILESLKWTVLSAVVTAVAIPTAIVTFINTLDDSWSLAIRKADEAGKLLAGALMSEAHGNRPVVLVGYSVGGRVIAACLSELAAIATGSKTETKEDEEKEENVCPIKEEFEFLTQKIESDTTLTEKERNRRLRAATIVRDAVIIGAPCDASPAKWAGRRSVVVGRLINVYNPVDWVLALIYRYKRWSMLSLAGLQEVKFPRSSDYSDFSRVENFNVSDLVDGHGDYPAKIREILDRVGVGDVNCEDFLPNYFPTEAKVEASS